ncbi:ABC transporter substrate-binding protein [uncultured Serinicoccus sp.]|uniref:ABC transporter substrate-binding protein n=1 Tax=uncultured Serinicoccus sp. TaxID=735514 RepID=UPI0026126300|nr:ABC transporter substrate-binding protein [uncultured Serinicoccus sp.]
MRVKTHLRSVAALSALALLAACGGDTADETATDESAAEDTAAEEDEGDGSSDDSMETEEEVAGGDGNTSDTFTFGYVLPETGQLAFLGPPQIEALGLAIEDINAAGGVLGQEVPAPVAGDEAGQEAAAQQAADRILAEQPSAIVGAAASGMSLAIIDRVTGANVMQCSGSNTAPTFTDYEDDGLYIRTAPSDALQGPVLANTIVNDGYSNVAIVARADDYGSGLAEATATALENAGATVALNETYDPLAREFNAVVSSVEAAQPDAVVVIAFEEGGQILQGMFEAGLTPDAVGVYGADGLRSADLGSIVNESDPSVIAGMKGTAPASADNPDFISRLQEFAPDLEETQFAPQVYDCAVTMALAAVAADSVNAADFKAEVNGVTSEGTECTSYEECLGLLEDGEDIDYNGASGPLDFTDAGEPGTATIEVYEFDDAGELQSVETVEANPAE